MVVIMIRYARSLLLLVSLMSLVAAGCSPTPGRLEKFGISLENAASLQHLATYGEGQALEIRLAADERWMAVRSTLGVHLYDTETWEPLELHGLRHLVSHMAVSPAGDLLALAIPALGEIQIWQVPEGRLAHSLKTPGERSALLDLRFAPDGGNLVSTALEEIDVWRVEAGSLVETFEAPEGTQFRNASISADGNTLAAPLVGMGLDVILAWQFDAQGSVTEYRAGEMIRFDAGQFTPTGEMYAARVSREQSGTADKILVWPSLTDPSALEIQDLSEIVSFAWAPGAESQVLATGHTNGEIMLWDVTLGFPLNVLSANDGGSVRLLQSDSAGKRLAVVYEDGSIGIWGLPEGTLQQRIEPTNGEAPTQIEMHPDGVRLFGVLPSGRVRIWDMQTGQEIGMLEKLTTGEVLDLAFAPDGEQLAAGLGNGLVSLWEPAEITSSVTLLDQGTRVDSVAFSPDTRALAAGVGGYISDSSYDDTVRVWDWNSATLLQQFAGEQEDVPGCSVFRNRVAFSPDGSLLASISHDFSIRLWDMQEHTLGKALPGHTQPVLDMTISADGNTLASASLDGTIRLWQIPNGTTRRIIEGDPLGMLAVALSPDGRLMAGASVVGVVSIWEADSGKLLLTLEGDMNSIGTLAFSADGSLIAAGKEQNLQLWSSQSGKPVASLPGEGGDVVSVTFSSDGNRLAFGSERGLIQVWELP